MNPPSPRTAARLAAPPATEKPAAADRPAAAAAGIVSPPGTPSLVQRVEQVHAGMERVSVRMGGVPVTEAIVFRLLVTLGREISALLEQALRPLDLSDTDFCTLMMLFSQPDGVAHPSELCLCVVQSPANMTRIADGLSERGLITRSPSDADRRRMILRITPLGEALVRELVPKRAERIEAMFGGIPPADRQSLLQGLKQLCANLDALTRLDEAASGTETAP